MHILCDELYERLKYDGIVYVADNENIYCDFENNDCPLEQEKADDQEDWRTLEASLDEEGGVDHTTQSGEEVVKLVKSG